MRSRRLDFCREFCGPVYDAGVNCQLGHLIRDFAAREGQGQLFAKDNFNE